MLTLSSHKVWALQSKILAWDPMLFGNGTLSDFETKVLNVLTDSNGSAEYDDLQFAGDILAVGLGYSVIMSVGVLWTVRDFILRISKWQLTLSCSGRIVSHIPSL